MKPSEIDLFGVPQQAVRAPNRKLEAGALIEILKALRAHPCVSWCERQNSGAMRIGKRFVKFGWAGASDVIGQMRDGRFLAVEVKSSTGKPTAEQVEFLASVNAAGGLAFVARNCADVFRALSND